MKSERKEWAEASLHAESRLIDYVQSGKDPAFAFQAYLWWRVACPSKAAAIDAVRAEQIELATRVGVVPDWEAIERQSAGLSQRFDRLQEAVLLAIEEIAMGRVDPKPHGLARANRYRAAFLMAEEARRRDTGATESDVRKAVAERMGLTKANVRKLVDEFHDAAATQLSAGRAFKELRSRLQEKRNTAAPKKRRSSSEHRWRR